MTELSHCVIHERPHFPFLVHKVNPSRTPNVNWWQSDSFKNVIVLISRRYPSVQTIHLLHAFASGPLPCRIHSRPFKSTLCLDGISHLRIRDRN